MYCSCLPISVCTVLSLYLCISVCIFLSPYLCLYCSCLPISVCTNPSSLTLCALFLSPYLCMYCSCLRILYMRVRTVPVSLSLYVLPVSQYLYIRVLSLYLCTYILFLPPYPSTSCILSPYPSLFCCCLLLQSISFLVTPNLSIFIYSSIRPPPASSHCPPLSPIYTLSFSAFSSDHRCLLIPCLMQVSNCPFSSFKILVHGSGFLFHFTYSGFVSSFLRLPVSSCLFLLIPFCLLRYLASCCSVCFLSFLSPLYLSPEAVLPSVSSSRCVSFFLRPLVLPVSSSLCLFSLSLCSAIFCFMLSCLFLVLFVSSLFVSRSCLAFCLLLQVCLLLP